MIRWLALPRIVASFAWMPLACAIAGNVRAQDLSVVAIEAPHDGCTLGADETVTLRLFNFGPALPAGSSFNVAYSIDAGAPATELVVLGATLLQNSALAYTFVTPADLSTPGTHALVATVMLPGDINPTNDALVGTSVTDWAASDGGTLSGPALPSTSGTLTSSGGTGAVVQWEESDDGGQRWFALANTGPSQDYADLRAPAQFRVRVRNGPCAEALSNVVTVSP